MMNLCTFWVPGKAVTQGSKRAVLSRVSKAGGARKPVMFEVNAATLRDWRAHIADVATQAMENKDWPRYVGVRIVFLIRGPAKSVSRGKRTAYPIGKMSGDVDKYARAVLDALTEVAFEDDCQVIDLSVKKRWTQTQAGVHIWIDDLEPNDVV